ncbi:serine/threonine-protein kinase [Cellvibrio fibrivorans]|uniref:Protein kinase domain-containing protein n=1 Tax=Cellvibrio fibrivorans TaxID=126350 RepID=A0ABU1USB7_9GAMM|nr:serine/threonine-protein kinase [Cellvibrio fibrivorans]MDR7088033.1 hypothetical protein [Cellvibrio fibrivorans]
MADNEESNKTSLRASVEEGETRVALGRPEPSLPVADTAYATQFTQYSAPHNHSTGFAQARELVKQSQSGKGRLLKKRFLLEDVLGHGGMGTVYKTKDLRKVEAEDPNPYIATKILNQDFKDHPDAFVTLQQETAKSQTLAHPNIVTVHDFDREGDTLFMTMELLEGQPLDQLIKAQRSKGLPKEQVWQIAKDLCAALAYAHQRQLIHADFKPGNVFVNTDGSAKVLDFGIARAASKEAQKHKFDAGQLGALTPAYATIEMVKDEPLGFSDDVYALACVIYEMLAGRHPYNNRSALEAYQQKLVPKRLDKLSAREWKALSHALALTKAERTASITQFVDELFPRRNPLMLTAAVGMALVSLAGAAWFGFSQHQAQQKVQATIAEKITQAQSCFATQDFACAIEQSLVATNLAPDNSVARQLLLAAQQAQEQRLQDDKIGELIGEAQRCLLQQDLECAAVYLQKAEAVGVHNSQVVSFHEALSVARAQQAQSATQKQAEIDDALARANSCFTARDYTCTVNSVDRILALDPAHAEAIALKQKIASAKEQEGALAGKVSRLMVDAENCMAKKNYSCAIAKAESVLELDAGYQPATTLKSRAQETQRKLKETGFTIK